MRSSHLSRREFLVLGTGAMSALLLPAPLRAAAPRSDRTSKTVADVEIALLAGVGQTATFGDAATAVWRYRGRLIRGRPDVLTAPNRHSWLGPMLRLRPGERFRAHIANRLPEATTVHWHGLHLPSDMDGQPRLPIEPGATFVAEFTVRDRPGIYWYHPHPHGSQGGRTGFQVYHGLAGLLVIESEEEESLKLPSGEHDLPIVIQDRQFDDNDQLVYLASGMQGMRQRMMGFLGDRIMVNGHPDHRVDVATRPYRLRLLNGSNSRIYKLAWSNGRPMTVLGTDGGMLPAPIQSPYLTLAPAQRRDLWVDFSDVPVGREVRLVSRGFEAGMMGRMMGSGTTDGGMKSGGMMGGMMSGMMGRGMMGGSMMNAERLPLGAEFDVMGFRVARREKATARLPHRLAAAPTLKSADAINRTHPRRFELMMRMMRGTINGRHFEGTQVADDEIVRLGSVEVWEFENRSMLPHPMHVHGLQFLVLERRAAMGAMGWNGLEDGHVDAGWHDTVLVMPGQRVRILLDFRDYTGLYLYHCHNLEHEDGGMMRYYRVRA
jgi:FtsP/CotA-like multicopper oxidase with cupredoxin domain